LIGALVNNYRVISILGEGAMGAVYLAQHPFMGRKAADRGGVIGALDRK
jgi:serine/threonine protein kinase